MTTICLVLAAGESKAGAFSRGKVLSPAPLFAWFDCGEKLGSNLAAARAALFTLGAYSVNNSPDFLMFAATVMAAESGFDRKIVSSAGAVGLMQVTTIGAREAGKQCHLPYDNNVSDEAMTERLLDAKANVRYGTCLLNYHLQQMRGNQMLALILYNGGGKQLTRFVTTGSLVKETLEYVLRVQSYYGRCIQ